ncbi:unnamed protein product, partial [Meganyctiphanes norvegica]
SGVKEEVGSDDYHKAKLGQHNTITHEKYQDTEQPNKAQRQPLLYYLASEKLGDRRGKGDIVVPLGAGAAVAAVGSELTDVAEAGETEKAAAVAAEAPNDPWSVAAPYVDGSYREVNDSYDYMKDMRSDRLLSSKGIPVQLVILLGSTARSGTSFMGELLAQQPDGAFYLFEPELFIRATTKEMVTEDLGLEHLQSMMHCDISSKFVKWLFTRSSASNIVHHTVTQRNCKPWTTCLTQPRLTEACRHEHNRLMKVIRMRIRWLEPLLTINTEVNVKILHLVRDPRGSLYSMDKNKLKGLDPEYYCPRIEDDIIYGRVMRDNYPHQFMSITYEDFCLDPYGKASEIWKFINGTESVLPSQWKSYLDKHTQSQMKFKSRLPVYGTVRNSKDQYQAWRQNIPEEV